MTIFQKEMETIRNGSNDTLVIMKRRRAEIERLEKKFKETRNGFVAQCIMQDIVRYRNEYNTLDEII